MKRIFDIDYRETIRIVLDQEVIDAIEIDDWRGVYINLPERGDQCAKAVAELVGVAMHTLNIPLSRVDGFADKTDDLAKIVEIDYELMDVTEIKQSEL
jgi:hypothetical protein